MWSLTKRQKFNQERETLRDECQTLAADNHKLQKTLRGKTKEAEGLVDKLQRVQLEVEGFKEQVHTAGIHT